MLMEIISRFLLVSLNIDAILGEVTIRQRRRKLGEMTQGNGLSDAYTATLSRMKAQKGYKSVIGLKVLMWVLYSERPLRADELCHALGVEVGSTDMDLENIPTLLTLVASCLGLVTVEATSSTVRLVHFTLQEHLLRNPTLFKSPHSEIVEVCLTYLNFGCIRDLSPTLRSAPAITPLLEYASIYWERHARRGMTEDIKILALRLLDRFDEHISVQLLYHYDQVVFFPLAWVNPEKLTGFTGLHGAAFFAIEEVVSAVLGMREWDVNAADCTGNTALTWAAMIGHDGAVKRLLERKDVNPDKPDTKRGVTPLSWAAENGHEGVVKILLGRKDVNPNHPDTFRGQTPLLWAAENRHEGVVKILLERKDVNPDHPDTRYGRAPLSWVAGNGHEGIVKMLLERKDVNPDHPDTSRSRMPLSWAALNGHEGIVKILLEREDVNPDHPDTFSGQTPLSCAAENGHEGIVKILLERKDVNPNHPDSFHGPTPLSWAAKRGREGVVKMLLERKDLNPDHPDTSYGRAPLSWAAENGHEMIVKMLLEREDVNPDRTDTEYGRTPLSWAARSGHEEIVEMLLERKNVRPANVNQTPQSVALSEGHYGVARIPLERGRVNCAAARLSSPTSLPPPTMHPDASRVEIQPRSHDPYTGITGSSGQPGLILAVHSEQPRLLDHSDSVPMSTDSGLPTQSPWWSRPLSTRPLKLYFRRKKNKPHPNHT